MTKTITLDNRPIGDGHPIFLAAEAGTTSNGDLDTAKKLADIAAETGFDAIKYQTIDPYQIAEEGMEFNYDNVDGKASENMIKMFEGLTFTPDQWRELAAHVRSLGLVFFSTVDHLRGVDFLDSLDVPIHKMGSWDVTYEPLIERMARTGKPVMLDLGPATQTDIDRYLAIYREHGNGEVIFLQDFHTDDPAQMNMRNIPYLKGKYGMPVGFSAPGIEHDLDILSVGLGANLIEKRITMDRNQKGHHHLISMPVSEMKEWVDRIRYVEASLGKSDIHPPKADTQQSAKYYRSICTTRPIIKGETFSMDNLDGKRPGTGIPTGELPKFLGKLAKRDYPVNTLLDWDAI